MVQVSTSINEETLQEIEKIAEKESRTLSQTVKILLEKAIKERNRKKTKNNLED
jgi:antitoxin component of RelBE/YafQ-DinJ toxin-antitoxin module